MARERTSKRTGHILTDRLCSILYGCIPSMDEWVSVETLLACRNDHWLKSLADSHDTDPEQMACCTTMPLTGGCIKDEDIKIPQIDNQARASRIFGETEGQLNRPTDHRPTHSQLLLYPGPYRRDSSCSETSVSNDRHGCLLFPGSS